MSTPDSFSSSEWRITDKQRVMIQDKLPKLSKKEAGLLISFIQHCIFERRASEVNKLQEKLDEE